MFFFSTFDAEHLAKIHRHQWKVHNKISKFAKFEGDILETGKNMDPQSRPPPYKRLQNFATLRILIFASFQNITLKRGKFPNFIVYFSLASRDFR